MVEFWWLGKQICCSSYTVRLLRSLSQEGWTILSEKNSILSSHKPQSLMSELLIYILVHRLDFSVHGPHNLELPWLTSYWLTPWLNTFQVLFHKSSGPISLWLVRVHSPLLTTLKVPWHPLGSSTSLFFFSSSPVNRCCSSTFWLTPMCY